MSILVIFDDGTRFMLAFQRFKKLTDVITRFHKQWPLAFKIDTLDLFPLGIAVSVDGVIALIHHPLEVFELFRMLIYRLCKAFAFIGQVEELDIDLGADELVELALVATNLLFAEDQNNHIDESLRQDWRQQ